MNMPRYTENGLVLQGARGPVKAVLCENWAIYQYWSITNHRFEVAVVELYDQAHTGITIPDLLFSTSNGTRSAYDPIAIEVGPSPMVAVML